MKVIRALKGLAGQSMNQNGNPEQQPWYKRVGEAIIDGMDRNYYSYSVGSTLSKVPFMPPEAYEGELFEPKSYIGDMAIRFAVDQDDKSEPEIFHTIQGEGRNLGAPTVFARLSGCNLACSWCDTPYTWAFNDTLAKSHDEGIAYDRKTEQLEITVGEAIDQITGFKVNRLVVTGGEPLMQQKPIAELIKGLREKDPNYWVEIETNGTIAPNKELAGLVSQFNVSPKLENSNNPVKKRLKGRAMDTFAAMDNADFKFVTFGQNDLSEIIWLVNEYRIPHERVFLMPEGRTQEEVEEHQRAIVEIAKQHNFNVTTRLHVLIWGAKRGV